MQKADRYSRYIRRFKLIQPRKTFIGEIRKDKKAGVPNKLPYVIGQFVIFYSLSRSAWFKS